MKMARRYSFTKERCTIDWIEKPLRETSHLMGAIKGFHLSALPRKSRANTISDIQPMIWNRCYRFANVVVIVAQFHVAKALG